MLKKIVEKLTNNNQTISTMESCTGGALVNEITNIEGSSNVLKFSAVTYSNEFKVKMGVSQDIIDKYTVYSKETAEAMAKAISDYTNSDYGIGITGKLNRVDENNLTGNDNEVFYSIFDRKKTTFYTHNVIVSDFSREENKKKVIMNIINLLDQILK